MSGKLSFANINLSTDQPSWWINVAAAQQHKSSLTQAFFGAIPWQSWVAAINNSLRRLH